MNLKLKSLENTITYLLVQDYVFLIRPLPFENPDISDPDPDHLHPLKSERLNPITAGFVL